MIALEEESLFHVWMEAEGLKITIPDNIRKMMWVSTSTILRWSILVLCDLASLIVPAKPGGLRGGLRPPLCGFALYPAQLRHWQTVTS